MRTNGAIMVNKEGKRFMNELTTREKASAAILAQTGKMAFMVFDEGVRQSLKQITSTAKLAKGAAGKWRP